jgi:hypothetical protein
VYTCIGARDSFHSSVLHLTMDASPNNPFSIKWDETKATTETIKWTLGINGATKHEIVSPILSKFELGNIMAHCLTVMHKIGAHVGKNAANPFALYMNVFPCTLLLPHVAAWDKVLVDHPLAVQDVASFQQAIWHFIAMHATDEDCHELLDYICSVAKPCKMDVQTYYSCLRELNHQVDWLPGTDLLISLSLRISCIRSSLMACLPSGRNSTRTPVVLSVILPVQTCFDSFVCNKRLLIVANRPMNLSSKERVKLTASATVTALSHDFTRK